MDKNLTRECTHRKYWEKWFQHIKVKTLEGYTMIRNRYGESAYSLDVDNDMIFCADDNNPEMYLNQAVATARTLGFVTFYELYSGPHIWNTYLPDKTLNASYLHGGHAPGQSHYHEEFRFKSGDKVLAFFDDYDLIIPSIVRGAVTEEYLREICDEFMSVESIGNYISNLPDYEWDSVIVTPLVTLRDEEGFMVNSRLVPRVNIFPYRKFDV